MKKVRKINIAKMKIDIKGKVESQKYYKNQRRTVRLVGERIISPSDATYKHFYNREDLRLMYAAYGLARGKTVSQIENKHSEDNHPLNEPYNKRRIEELIQNYEHWVEVEEEVQVEE